MGGIVLAGLVIGSGIWLLSSISRVQKDLHQLHKTPTEAAKREFDASLEATKALVGGIGTIATIIGGIFLYVNYKQAQDKLNHEKEKAKKDAELAESRLITERFSKAVEQLGSDKIEVRIGGIYALEQIAKDSGKYKDLDGYQWTVMEILTAFIRERSPFCPKKQIISENSLNDQNLSPITTDVQAALTVIGRRNISKEALGQVINLSYTSLAMADLSGANFDNANLSEANLTGSNLSRTQLNEVDLSGTYLIDASLNGASLIDADLSATFLVGTRFFGANLTGASFQGASHLDMAKFCKTTMPDGKINSSNCKEFGLSAD
jgi:hypothetical protein